MSGFSQERRIDRGAGQSRQDVSEGLGQAIRVGDHAAPVAIPTELTGAQWIGNIALSATTVAFGLASVAVLNSAAAVNDLAKLGMRKVKSRVLGALPHDIEAGKYLD